jgi:3-hydroxybutyryl-CoA dehydrogenase
LSNKRGYTGKSPMANNMKKSSGKLKTPARATRPQRVVIIGAGRMGADIALAFALGGWQCNVLESDRVIRERANGHWRQELKRLRASRTIDLLRMHADADTVDWNQADLAVECVFEDLELKRKLLKSIEPRMRRDAIIATNTSSLRITDVTSVLKDGSRGAGLHFSVPSHVMLAVEITRGRRTSDGTMKKLSSWMTNMGKVPIVINRDVPGMVINRIQHAMYRELYHLIDEGIATAETVDLAVRFGFGFRYWMLGPVVSRDIHGLPVHLAVSKQIYPTLHNGKTPSKRLRQLVKDGHHGVRTGRGFYRWDPKTIDSRLTHFTELLEETLKRVKRRGQPTEF